MKFRSLQGDIRLTSIQGGHTAIVGEDWRELPEHLHRDALAAGCECDQGKFKAAAPQLKSSDEALSRPTSHDDVIRTALMTMLERNAKGDFTQDGNPNVNAVQKLAGLSLRKDDVMRVFRAMQAEAGDGDGDASKPE